MAVWLTLDKKYSWSRIAELAKKKLEIGEWQRNDLAKNKHNAIRVGFAKFNEEEIKELIFRLKNTINQLIVK
jgi:GntR family transcriptional regulator/MocR family aminotransferase